MLLIVDVLFGKSEAEERELLQVIRQPGILDALA